MVPGSILVVCTFFSSCSASSPSACSAPSSAPTRVTTKPSITVRRCSRRRLFVGARWAPRLLALGLPALLLEAALTRAPVGFVGRRLRRRLRGLARPARRSARSRARGCAAASARPGRSPAPIGPSLARTRRRSASVSAGDGSTSKSASTRVELFCACWPPGPLDREKRNAEFRPNRLGVHGCDSARRGRCAACLRRADPGRGRCGAPPRAARATGSASSRTRPRCPAASSASRLRSMGFARRGRRAADDRRRRLEGARGQAGARADDAGDPGRPRGARADRDERRRRARRRRRRERRARPDLLLPEPQPGVPGAARRRRALLPAPEPLVADDRRAAARLGRVRRGARVRGRHRGDRARQAEPCVLRRRDRGDRRRPGDDLDGRRRHRGRHRSARRASGCAPCSCAPASSGPTSSSRRVSMPDGIVSSIAQLPDWLEANRDDARCAWAST